MSVFAMPEAVARPSDRLERPCPHCGARGVLRPHCQHEAVDRKGQLYLAAGAKPGVDCGWLECTARGCRSIVEISTFAHYSTNTQHGHGKIAGRCAAAR